MSDDPYRSLAWRLRKDDGFCRAMMAQKEFAEFIWADWLRTRPEFPVDQVRASAKNFVAASKALARSPATKNLPAMLVINLSDSSVRMGIDAELPGADQG